MPPCCIATIYYWINVATELLVWIVPFLSDSPQTSPPVPDEPAIDLLTYLPHPLITLPVPPPLPTSPMTSGYFVPPITPAMTSTFEPLYGTTAYFKNLYNAILRTDILCLDGSSFPGCLLGRKQVSKKSLIQFDWKENIYHVIAIGFIAGILYKHMYRRMSTYPLPTSVQVAAFLDKMKRLFEQCVPGLPRTLGDHVFPFPGPVHVSENPPPGLTQGPNFGPLLELMDNTTRGANDKSTLGAESQTPILFFAPTSDFAFAFPPEYAQTPAFRSFVNLTERMNPAQYQSPAQIYAQQHSQPDFSRDTQIVTLIDSSTENTIISETPSLPPSQVFFQKLPHGSAMVSAEPYNPTPSYTSILVLDKANAEMSSPISAQPSSSLPLESGTVNQGSDSEMKFYEKVFRLTQRKHLN